MNQPSTTTAHQLEIVRIFDAPRELVFKAWTDDELGKTWAPNGHSMTYVSGDLRPGGAWRNCMRNDASGEEMCQSGVYREVAPPERLVFTFAWEGDDGKPEHEMLVSLLFEDVGGKTRMTFRQTGFASEQSRNNHEGGWNQAFDALERALRR